MKYSVLALLALLSLLSPACAQSSAGFIPGQVLTSAELNTAFQGKADYPFGPALPQTCYNATLFGADPTGVANSDSAIAAMIAAAGANPICVDFGPGLFKFANQAAFSGFPSLAVRGAGSQVTTLFWPAGGGLAAAVNARRSVHFSGLLLLTGATTTSNSAITVTGSGVQNNNLQNTFDDISCMGFDYFTNHATQTDYWKWCIETVLVNNTNARNINVYGSISNLGGGVSIAGSAPDFGIIFNLSDSAFFNTSVGFLYGTFFQGVTIRNSNFTLGTTGISVPATSSGTFQLNVTDSQFNTTGNQIDIESDITSVSISHNLFFVPGSKCGIVIGGGRQIAITGGNAFLPFSGFGSPALATGVCINVSDPPGTNIVTGNVYGGQSVTLDFGNMLNTGSHNWLIGPNNYANVTQPNNNGGTGNIIEHFTNGPPTVAGACGGGTPSVDAASTDLAGAFTEGTTATGCSINFQHGWAAAPNCLVAALGAVAVTAVGTSPSQFSITNASSSGQRFSYICSGGP